MDLTSNFHSSSRLSPKQFVCVYVFVGTVNDSYMQDSHPGSLYHIELCFCTLKAFYAGGVMDKRKENAKCLDVKCLVPNFSGPSPLLQRMDTERSSSKKT